ncbi:D-tyrosyl-tRNA(Tyr) deacylase [bacterium]|nr:MAG: D-tyrosyl-tRNA(Tyr) deacylase [bacterium]
MRGVVQRVKCASVTVAGEEIGRVGKGFLVLLGVEEGDTLTDVEYIVDKIAGLRVFEDRERKMNLPLGEVGGGVLLVSQFTLLGDCRKGRRPSFTRSAPMDLAESLYLRVAEGLRGEGFFVATGKFRAEMEVSLVNEGPVTMLLDSRKVF